MKLLATLSNLNLFKVFLRVVDTFLSLVWPGMMIISESEENSRVIPATLGDSRSRLARALVFKHNVIIYLLIPSKFARIK